MQGSKQSGLLYTIYTNEVPILQEVLKEREICETIGAYFFEECPLEQTVVNFVDASNCVISAKPNEDLDAYTNSYYRLLEI